MSKNTTKYIICLVVLILLSSILIGCVQKHAETINNKAAANLKEAEIKQENLVRHIEELISEKYEGRMPGTEFIQLLN